MRKIWFLWVAVRVVLSAHARGSSGPRRRGCLCRPAEPALRTRAPRWAADLVGLMTAFDWAGLNYLVRLPALCAAVRLRQPPAPGSARYFLSSYHARVCTHHEENGGYFLSSYHARVCTHHEENRLFSKQAFYHPNTSSREKHSR